MVRIATIRRYALSSFGIIQAYLQRLALLRCIVYIRTPTEIADPLTNFLCIRKALYVLSDSKAYWHEKFARVLKDDIGLSVATSCLAQYYCDGVEMPSEGMIVIQMEEVWELGMVLRILGHSIWR